MAVPPASLVVVLTGTPRRPESTLLGVKTKISRWLHLMSAAWRRTAVLTETSW